MLTNEMGLPRPFVDAVDREHRYVPKRYSVTSLLKGVREAILLRRHVDEIDQDVSDMVWLIFGTAVHSVLERSQESDTQLKEGWLSVEMPNGYSMSGIFDLYDDSTGTVTDYKTASVWKVIKGEFDDYRTQVLAYCWMLRRHGFDARRGEIVMLLKDHSKTKAETDRDYPKRPVAVVSWDFTDGDLDDFGMWAEARFEEIERCERLPDDELPVCTPEERWARPEKWAVTKRGNKKASRLFDTEREALAYASFRETEDKRAYDVTHRPGEDVKCLKYCPVKAFCDYFKEEACNS